MTPPLQASERLFGFGLPACEIKRHRLCNISVKVRGEMSPWEWLPGMNPKECSLFVR